MFRQAPPFSFFPILLQAGSKATIPILFGFIGMAVGFLKIQNFFDIISGRFLSTFKYFDFLFKVKNDIILSYCKLLGKILHFLMVILVSNHYINASM